MDHPTAAYNVPTIMPVIEGASIRVAIRGSIQAVNAESEAWLYIRRSKDASLKTVELEDVAAMLGLVFAFIVIFLGLLLNNPYLDGTRRSPSACCG